MKARSTKPHETARRRPVFCDASCDFVDRPLPRNKKKFKISFLLNALSFTSRLCVKRRWFLANAQRGSKAAKQIKTLCKAGARWTEIEAGSRSPLHNPASTHGRLTTAEPKVFPRALSSDSDDYAVCKYRVPSLRRRPAHRSLPLAGRRASCQLSRHPQ